MWYHYDITFVLRCQEIFEKSHSTVGCMRERATIGRPFSDTILFYYLFKHPRAKYCEPLTIGRNHL